MRVKDIDFYNILLEEKSFKASKNILIYEVSYKTFLSAKALHIRLKKLDGFIKIYDGISIIYF